MNKQYFRTPLNYTGGKYRLLSQIIPLFPPVDTVKGKFYDVFCGGLSVSLNYIDNTPIIANDGNKHIIDMYRQMSSISLDELLTFIDEKLDKLYNGDELEEYRLLRDIYNTDKEKNALILLLLSHLSFNNHIRFNRKDDFNMSYGYRLKTTSFWRNNIIRFYNTIKEKDLVSQTGISEI